MRMFQKKELSEEVKNKLFWLGVFAMIFFSIAFAFYKYIFRMNFTVLFHASCNPTSESCFLSACDPAQEGSECSDDPREDGYFYALRKVKAYRVAECPQDFKTCVEEICAKPESKCVRSLCDPKVPDEENGPCYGPNMTQEETEQYVIHPSEKDSLEEGDVSQTSDFQEGESEKGSYKGN